jgi:hypothetical protein
LGQLRGHGIQEGYLWLSNHHPGSRTKRSENISIMRIIMLEEIAARIEEEKALTCISPRIWHYYSLGALKNLPSTYTTNW